MLAHRDLIELPIAVTRPPSSRVSKICVKGDGVDGAVQNEIDIMDAASMQQHQRRGDRGFGRKVDA